MNSHAEEFARRRAAMVREQIEARGVRDARVLQAMRELPRERFVRPGWEAEAYDDNPLPIAAGQKINYDYGGGWAPFKGWASVTPEKLIYPGDPPFQRMATMRMAMTPAATAMMATTARSSRRNPRGSSPCR
mgnify:CR=1 FL=1